MATNPDTITSADLDKTDTAGIAMDKHFEAAGIETEPNPDANAQDIGAKGGEGEKDKGAGKEAAAGDKKPEAGKAAGESNPKDDKSKQPSDGKAKEDKGGDLAAGDLKLADGTIVKAGAERRHYETARLAQQRVADLDNQLRQMTGSRDKHRDELQQLRNTVQQVNGAQPEELSIGVQLVRDLKRDPAGTLRTLLAEAVGSGIKVEGITSGLDADAIKHIIASVGGNTQQQQGPTEEQITQEAVQATNEFFTQFPDARLHEATLARVLIDHPQLELKDAYYQLKQSFINRGFDWSRPLAEQIANEGNQQQQQQNGQQDNTKPMPNGRGVADIVPADKIAVAHESMDTGDIIKEAMREAGINIQ